MFAWAANTLPATLPLPKETSMPVAPKRRISPDTWAVAIALVAAALIHFHLLKSIPW
jgi:hypothetical protein